MSRLQEIVQRFPIRKSREQKDAFLRYAVSAAKAMGFTARVEENGRDGKHRNFVAGAPDSAPVIFTAHYDTPANMLLPNLIIPRNLPLFFAYQLLVVGMLAALCLGAAFLAYLLFRQQSAAAITFLLLYYGLLFLMMQGPANKNNVNDNTSGVASVLRLMELLPEEARGQAAFVLFDNEEKGRLGSKAFAVQHPQVKKNTLVINMDCVGVGEHLLIIAKNYARALGDPALLQQVFSPDGCVTPHFFPSSGITMNSDHKSFRRGVGIVACKRRKWVGYYTPCIHTRRDTRASDGNIEYLAQNLAKFVKSLAEV